MTGDFQVSSKMHAVTDDAQDDKRQKAIAAVKDAWKVLVSVAPEDPGEIIDVAHVRVVDGEGERVDAALAVETPGHGERTCRVVDTYHCFRL